MSDPKLERRFNTHKVEIRESGDADSAPTITGMAAVFNTRSENLGGFTEIIAPGAFDGVLQDDTRGLFNHDANIVLGRRGADTLKLTVTDEGLRYDINPPDTQLVRDMVLEPMRRGDIDQSSFGFFVGEDDWSEDKDTGAMTRTITKVDRLLDVSPVTFPAYPDTKVAVTRMEEFRSIRGGDDSDSPDGDDDQEVEELRAEVSRLRGEVKRLADLLR